MSNRTAALYIRIGFVVLLACAVSATVSLYAIEKHLALASQALALMVQTGRVVAPAVRPSPKPSPRPLPKPKHDTLRAEAEISAAAIP